MSGQHATGQGRRELRFGPWMRDNFVLYFVAAGAYGGNLTHWLHLARRYGQGGWSAWFLALCVDALAFHDRAVASGQRGTAFAAPAMARLRITHRCFTGLPCLTHECSTGLT